MKSWETWPQAGLGQMEDLLGEALVAAEMLGRFMLLEETGGDQ